MKRPLTPTVSGVDDNAGDDGGDDRSNASVDLSFEAEKGERERREELKAGTRLGGASLGLLFVANSLCLGFQQSKRDELGCDSLCMGSLSSFKSTARLVAATVLGRLSDTDTGISPYLSGRRVVLWVGIAATLVGIHLESNSSSIRDLWYAVVPIGLFEQNANILKALFGEYHESVPGGCTPGERASSAGIVGLVMGLAMMIGPMLGSSVLSTYQEAKTVATVLLLISAVLVALLPTPANKRRQQQQQQQQEHVQRSVLRKRSSSFLDVLDVPSARSPAGLFLLAFRLLSSLSYHIYSTILISSLRDRFHFGQKDYGMFFSVVGLFFALSQGFVAKLMLDKFGKTGSERARLLVISTFLIGTQRFLAFYTTNLIFLYAFFALMVVAYGVSSTVFAADTAQVAAPEELGAFFGLVAAVESAAGMAGPIMGGALTFWHPTKAPLLASVSISAGSTLMLAKYYEEVVLGHTSSPSSKPKQD